MDTFKDRQQLEDIYARGNAPWEVWNEDAASPRRLTVRRGVAPEPRSMRRAQPAERHADSRPLRVLCLGAHSDDIEIGCGGLILSLIKQLRAALTSIGSCSPRRRARARGASASAGIVPQGGAQDARHAPRISRRLLSLTTAPKSRRHSKR